MGPDPELPFELGEAPADGRLDREISALRAATIGPGQDGVKDRKRLLLGELLMWRALGVRPSLLTVQDVARVTQMLVRLTDEEGRQDLDDALSELMHVTASLTLHSDELTLAGRWLSEIRRLRLGRLGSARISSLTSALNTTGMEDLQRPVLSARLAIERSRRRRLAGRDSDLAELRRAREGLPGDHPDRPMVVAEIGLVFARLAERGHGNTSGPAAASLTDALGLLPAGHALCEEVLPALAKTLFGLHGTGLRSDLLEKLIALVHPETEPAHPALAQAVHGLALVLLETEVAETAGMEQLRSAGRLLAAHHPLYGMVMAVLGSRSARRAEAEGDPIAMESAETSLAIAERALGDEWAHAGFPRCAFSVTRAGGQVMRARLGAEPFLAARAITALESDLARLPATDPWAPRALRLLGEAWRVRGELLDCDAELRRGCELVIAAGDITPATHPDSARLAAAAAVARADLARLLDGSQERDAAIQALSHATDRAGLTPVERAEMLLRLATVLRDRSEPGDAEHLTARLEQAAAVLAGKPGHPLALRVTAALGSARRLAAEVSPRRAVGWAARSQRVGPA